MYDVAICPHHPDPSALTMVNTMPPPSEQRLSTMHMKGVVLAVTLYSFSFQYEEHGNHLRHFSFCCMKPVHFL